MSRTADPPDGDRFFARILAAMLECPRCGWLDSFHWRRLSRLPTNLRSRRMEDKTPGWDPTTASWRCGQCGLLVTLGVLAWPLLPVGSRATSRPRDQVPNERELAQLRARGSGIWLPQAQAIPRHRAPDTNITAKCTCLPPALGTHASGAWTGEPREDERDPACLIHGDLVRARAAREGLGGSPSDTKGSDPQDP